MRGEEASEKGVGEEEGNSYLWQPGPTLIGSDGEGGVVGGDEDA